MPRTEPKRLQDIMEPQTPHRASRNLRDIRWKIFELLDSKSLRSLRRTSKYFFGRLRTQEKRMFSTVRLCLDLSDRCKLNHRDSLLALERIGKKVKRAVITFRGGVVINYELRHETDTSRRSTLNPVPLEGHFTPNSEYYLKEARTPKLGGLFEDLSPRLHSKGFFQKVFDQLPRLESMALYFTPAAAASAGQNRWGRTLLDEALIHLRSQYEASLDGHANLVELKLHLDSPLALWHLRSFPGYGDSGSPLLGREGPWRKVKMLDLALPSYNISDSSQRMKIMKRGIHSFLSAFSPTLEELALTGGGGSDIGNPLMYDLEPECAGHVGPTRFPKLSRLRLRSMCVCWAGAGGLERFLTSPERGDVVVSLVLHNVRILGEEGWEKLYAHFELEHPEKMVDPAAPLCLSRKIDLVPISPDASSGRLVPAPHPS